MALIASILSFFWRLFPIIRSLDQAGQITPPGYATGLGAMIAGFIGLGVAADYLQQLGQENVEAREAELLAHFTEELRRVDGLRIIGEAPEKAAVVSFLIDGAHAHDLATLLDLEGVAVRSGQHCAHPLLQYFGVAATCRASLAFYNTHAEIERFMTALTKVRKLLG